MEDKDIIDELREFEIRSIENALNDPVPGVTVDLLAIEDLMRRAADEIELLRLMSLNEMSNDF